MSRADRILESVNELSEASEVEVKDLDKNKQKVLKNIEQIMGPRTLSTVFEGIHGVIAMFEDPNRLDGSDLKKLSGMKDFRWMEVSSFATGVLSIGF